MRGGLLGQGSILTLTANGVDTSPVIRGIWVLESLLGTPPAPPPPDVEPIDPDVRGAKTVKDLLEKHRSVQARADCHAKIDPYGFALEYFDPVGGYRPTYYRSRFWRNSTQSTKFFLPSYRRIRNAYHRRKDPWSANPQESLAFQERIDCPKPC